MGISDVKDRFKQMPPGMNMDQAIVEAERCLLCHDAPCSKACPAGTEPGEFIRKLRLRNITGAIRTIKSNNILGGACGVLCPTAELCERECSAMMASDENPGGSDKAIRIGDIQRFLVEHSREIDFQPVEVEESGVSGKIAVVGSGPAGLSCAAEVSKLGYKATIFEALAEPGGVLRYGVVPFRCDTDFVEKEIADVTALGVEIKCNSPIEGKAAAEDLLKQGYDAVFMAPGLWGAYALQDDSANIDGCYSSVDFLASIRNENFDNIISSEVILDVEKYRQTAEIKVKVYKDVITAKVDSDDMYASIEKAVDKVKRQLKKYKGKLKEKQPEEINEAVEKVTKPETDVDSVDI